MEFQIQARALERALAKTQGVLKGKKIDPLLSCVAIEASAGKLRVSASDREMTVAVTVDAEVSAPGVAYVNGKAFFEAVRGLPDEVPTTVKRVGTSLETKAKKAQFRFPTVGTLAEGYVTGVDKLERFQVAPKLLADMIGRTSYCIGTDQSRPSLTGALFQQTKTIGQTRIAATDGHRLAFIARPIGFPPTLPPMSIPDRALVEIKRLLEEEKHTDMGATPSQVAIWTPDTTLVAGMVSDQFPDVEQIIPPPNDHPARLSKAAILATIDRMALLNTAKLTSLMAFRFNGSTLILVCDSQEVGHGEDEIEIEYAGPPISIGFNPVYVAEAVMSMATETVEFHLHDPLSPVLIRPAAADDTQCAVVMPMRL